jgi:hypothetical protein
MDLLLQPSAQAEEEKGGIAGEEASKGCVSERKSEEDSTFQQEAAAAKVVGECADATTDEVVWDDVYDYDSDDSVDTVVAKAKARFYAVIESNKQWLQPRDDSVNEGDSVHGDEADGAVAAVVNSSV